MIDPNYESIGEYTGIAYGLPAVVMREMPARETAKPLVEHGLPEGALEIMGVVHPNEIPEV